MTRTWLIDGMNLIGSRPDRWWNDPDRAMRDMAASLGDYAALTGEDVTVVFDRRPSEFHAPNEARVVFAAWKGRNAADHEIEQMIARTAEPGGVRVVTSDKRLAERVRAHGAAVVSAGTFRDRLERTLAAR